MPNRSFSASGYRYGFNGQEKDDEVNGNGNSNTAEFWEYDTRLGHRWNLDPKPTFGTSDYVCFGDNPVLNSDILGDKLKSGTDQQSQNDIKSVVKDKYKDGVKIDSKTGDVSLNFDSYKEADRFKSKDGSFNQKKFDKFVKRAMKSEGISLLNDLITAKDKVGNDENYYYGASYHADARLRSDPSQKAVYDFVPGSVLDVSKGQYPQINLSTTPHSPNTPGELPPAGYDGYVIIPPGTAKQYTDATKQILIEVPRGEMVKHELSEIYLRTHYKQTYEKAHNNAGGMGTVDFFYVK
jgi:hypothetical protein